MAGSAIMNMRASDKAADAVEGGADNALALQDRMFQQTRSDLAPWRDVGGSALNAYARAMGLPQSSGGGGSGGGSGSPSAYGNAVSLDSLDPNQKVNEQIGELLFTSILGRHPSEGGQEEYNQWRHSMAPGRGGSKGGSGGGLHGRLDPLGLDPVYQSTPKGERDIWRNHPTVAQYIQALRDSPEYQTKAAGGRLPPNEAPGQGSRNYIRSRGDQTLYGGATNAAAEGAGSPGGSPAPDEDRYGGFETSPGYQWRKDEGQGYLDRSFAGGGGYLSGARLKAGAKYNQNAASDEFSNYMNRLAAAANIGQTATTQQVGANQNYGANAANLAQNKGDARASGYLAAGNAITSGVNNWLAANPYGKWGNNNRYANNFSAGVEGRSIPGYSLEGGLT